MKPRSDIQGLRALAVSLVVLSHVGLFNLTGGYVGVDVFFVVSGYLITFIILKEYAANAALLNGLGWFSLRAFYLRRFKRIAPASFLVLVITTIASYLLFNPVKARGVAVDAVWSAFFLANFHIINVATDYFHQGFASSPLSHFWSLAVEEQFYLVFPTLLIGALSLHGLKIRSLSFNWRQRIGILVGFLSLSSFTWAVIATSSEPASSYFSSLSRAWEIGLGALLAVSAQSSRWVMPLKLRNFWSALGFLAIIFSAFSFTPSTPFPGFYTLIPTLGTVIIIASGINGSVEQETIIQRISSFAPIRLLGNISYSVYLWHLPILIIANQKYSAASSLFWFKLILIILILLIATLTYFVYENPLRRRIKIPTSWYQTKYGRNKVFRKNFILGLGFSSIILVTTIFLILVLVPRSSHSISSQNESDQKVVQASAIPSIAHSPAPIHPSDASQPSYSEDFLRVYYGPDIIEWQNKVADGAILTKLPKNYQPEFANLISATRAPGHFDYQSCQQLLKGAICRGGISSSDAKKVLVIGDSHAEITWEIIAQNYGLAADIYLIRLGGCPFSDITRVINSLSPGDCSRFRRAIPSAIADIKPDTIVLSDYISGKNDNGTSISRSEIASGLRTSVTRYKKLASTVIVMGEFPTQPVGLTDCVLASGLLSRSCFGKVADTQYIRDLESKVALSLNVGFVDPTPIFCYSLICPPVIDNILVRLETNHTTDNFTLKVAPFFGFYFDKLGILGTP